MPFLLNEKTGTIVPANKALLKRSRNQLKEISDAEAHRRLSGTTPAASPAADSSSGEPDSGKPVTTNLPEGDPRREAFDEAVAKIEAISDKDSLEKFARDEYAHELNKSFSLKNLKNQLISVVKETLGV